MEASDGKEQLNNEVIQSDPVLTEAALNLESEKSDISWGNQIRSYILDDSRIKDLRTKHETGNTQGVLDGDLDAFIEKSLKEGL